MSPPPHLVISSTGPAAEVWGHYMGLFDQKGELNGAAYYVQRDDFSNDKIYLYKDPNNAWRVGKKLGSVDDRDCAFYHAATPDTESPPGAAWQYRDGPRWQDFKPKTGA